MTKSALSSDPLASINIAGHVGTRARGVKVVTCVVKLSGVDGSVLDFQQVDHADGTLSPPQTSRRVVGGDAYALRAKLVASAAGHVIGQLPWKGLVPFALVGAGC